MTRVSPALWDQLVAAYEEAERRCIAASDALDALPLPDNEAGEKSEQEAAWEAAFAEEARAGDRLLSVQAPHPAGAALQLRIFALRHHAADLAEAAEPSEDPGAAILRRIRAGLLDMA